MAAVEERDADGRLGCGAGECVAARARRAQPWQPRAPTSLPLPPNTAYAEELYPHTGDESTNMDQYENANQAVAAPAVAAKLRARLRSFFDRVW
jgi:hypothetical protein